MAHGLRPLAVRAVVAGETRPSATKTVFVVSCGQSVGQHRLPESCRQGVSPSQDTASSRHAFSGIHDVGTRTQERPLGRSGRVSRGKTGCQTGRRARIPPGRLDSIDAGPPATETAGGQARIRPPLRLGRSGFVPGTRALQGTASDASAEPAPAHRGSSPACVSGTAAPQGRSRPGRILVRQSPAGGRAFPSSGSRVRADATSRRERAARPFAFRSDCPFPARWRAS